MAIDRALAKALSPKIIAQLTTFGEDHNVRFDARGGVLELDGTWTMKIHVTQTSEDAAKEREATAKANFETYADLVGLKPTDYLRTFRHKGHVFTVNKIDLGKPKFCIGATRDDGKQYGFPQTQRGFDWIG
jgi:hypothetical protein